MLGYAGEPVDSVAEFESRMKSAELHRIYLELDTLKAKLDTLTQDNINRNLFAKRIYRIVLIWLGVIAVVTGNLIVRSWVNNEVFPENFSLALIGGTTVTVLGLMVIVLNYLFPKGQD